MRLGVNVDHIATLRQARQEGFPDPALAAKEILAASADGIVCHLREDRRHINDDDLNRLRQLPTRLDMEMALTDEMVEIALKVKPDMVTLVPEKRQEITTEGGLDVKCQIKNDKLKIKEYIANFKKRGIIVSLFVDPDPEQIEAAQEAGADFVELHTGAFANTGSKQELEKIKQACQKAKKLKLRVNAGHGLDYNNVKEIIKIPEIEELNIGFSIIARSVFVGLKQAVIEMREAMR